jgi:hypothetical protein
MTTTFKSALLDRRAVFLDRHALRDDTNCTPSLDNRVAFTRRFLEGGDDVSPGCLQNGQSPPRRPPPLLQGDDQKLACLRINTPNTKNVYSDVSDWDQFASDSSHQVCFERIAAQIARAVEVYNTGTQLAPQDVFDLWFATLPGLDESTAAMTKAWSLLFGCGCDPSRLERLVTNAFQPAFDRIAVVPPSSADAWRDAINQAHADVRASMDVFKNQNQIPLPDCAGPPEPPEPELSDDCRCQPSSVPPITSFIPRLWIVPPLRLTPLPPQDVSSAQANAADAILAAAGKTSADSLTAMFRGAHFSEATIVAIYNQLASDWSRVPDERKFNNASQAWQARHPEFAPPQYLERNVATEPADPVFDTAWEAVRELIESLEGAATDFVRLDSQHVRKTCADIIKATWTDDNNPPFPHGDDASNAGYNRSSFQAAADRAALRDDCPFRLAALLESPEGYSRVLDNIPPSSEDGTGANRLARPTLDNLSAFYWRNVVLASTLPDLLAREDTADFHAVSHLRFLGLFRPGGRQRPGLAGPNTGPIDGEFEQWISTLIPTWFLDFAKAALLRFKYWVTDAPTHRQTNEEMTFWSENHQMNFASSEYIAGRSWGGEEFTWTGQTGDWHAKRAFPRVEKWLLRRLQFGFSEVNSGTYYNEHLPPLFNLIDFACQSTGSDAQLVDPEGFRIRQLAIMVVDLILYDVVRRMCEGSFVAASGRAYYGSKSSAWAVSITNFIEIVTGLIGDFGGPSESTALDFVTSDYVNLVPDSLIALGLHRSGAIVDRSRTSIDVADGSSYGIGYDSDDDMIFWWGCGAYFTDQTYDKSKYLSERWYLQDTGPFKVFPILDYIVWDVISRVIELFFAAIPIALSAIRQAVLDSILGSLVKVAGAASAGASANAALSLTPYPVSLLHAALMSPLVLRVFVDTVLGLLDALIAVGTAVLKKIGVLDENDDRIRVARSRIEQAMREFIIDFNAGSLLGRQHIYGWRGADAALSSMIDDHKSKSSAQKEPCIASLGPNISVFTGKPPKLAFSKPGSIGDAVVGYGRGSLKYLYDPETITWSQLEMFGGQPAPEALGFAVPIIGAAVGKELFGDDGPGYWFGSISSPLVYQHENVAIAMYRPTPEQKDLSDEMTHVYWPWDHFDEVQTDEASGGRWVFGRRDRRFPPRTPCQPGKQRPTAATPWPTGKFRGDESGPAGYVAVFSGAGLKTIVPDPGQLDANKNFVPGNWGDKELVADGHENVFILVVGDSLTYGSLDQFRKDVLAAQLSCSVSDGTCSITMPNPGSSSSNKGTKFEASWDNGAKVDNVSIDTSSWPRFELQPTTLQSIGPAEQNPLVTGFRVYDPNRPDQDGVPWDAKGWRLEVTVSVWETDDQGEQKQTQTTLHLEHDWSSTDTPVRDTGDLANNFSLERKLSVGTTRQPSNAAPVQSVLGQAFRTEVQKNFRKKVLYAGSK